MPQSPQSSHAIFSDMGLEVKSRAFKLEDFCFDKQLEFIKDPSKFKVACNSRRSGKTMGAAGDLIDTCDKYPGYSNLYLGISRAAAKLIFWDPILNINEKFKLGGKSNNQDLTMTFPNNSKIILGGILNETEIRKWLGGFYKKIYIDEGQSYKDYLRKLIFDVLMPTMWDVDGSISLLGVPAARRYGVFYDAVHGQEGFKDWKQFHWTVFDNPHIKIKSGKEPREIIEEDIKIQGLSWDHPTIRRNAFGEWAEDDSALVYAYNSDINTYITLPEGLRLDYVLGLDFGWEDADAAVLWGYSKQSDTLYMIEEGQRSKQTISDLAAWIKEFQSRYAISKIVGDTGGLGKKIVEEIYQRHGIYIQAAEKSRKREFIELMNSDFRIGKIKVLKKSGIAGDWGKLEWDTSTFPYKEDSRLHCYTHRPDAALYAYREAKHWAFEPKKPTPIKTAQEQVEECWEDLAINFKHKQNEVWWERDSV